MEVVSRAVKVGGAGRDTDVAPRRSKSLLQRWASIRAPQMPSSGPADGERATDALLHKTDSTQLLPLAVGADVVGLTGATTWTREQTMEGHHHA